MEGAERWWCNWVPVECSKSVVVGWAKVGPADGAGDVYDGRAGWVRVV